MSGTNRLYHVKKDRQIMSILRNLTRWPLGYALFVIFGMKQFFELYQLGSARESTRKALVVREPLSNYINAVDQTVHNVQSLVDFAIIGHAKTGTTFLKNRLLSHPDIAMHRHELTLLHTNNITGMTRALYELEPSKTRGYKSPNDILLPHALEAIHQYWPATKLVVGIRHPIQHFESAYNFRARAGARLAPPQEMIGSAFFNLSLFHRHLARLGKTEMVSEAEISLLDPLPEVRQRLGNPVFLYHTSQMFDATNDRNKEFGADLQHYLGLSQAIDMERLPPRKQKFLRTFKRFFGRSKPKSRVARTSPEYHAALDICADEYIALRHALLQQGIKASKWIREYFMNHVDVTISNPAQFASMLDAWNEDPCVNVTAIPSAPAVVE
ncbi:hypothetical protein MPSEU_000541800 [Mayamaea pseudoterrestris]|nr:hypothetical protein MPSEU_000541800 [Mayamaea pseudoterrestris]